MHPSFFILHLTPDTSHPASREELRGWDPRCKLCNLAFFILQVTKSAEISELKHEKDGMHNVVR